jgi:hypothetical protein
MGYHFKYGSLQSALDHLLQTRPSALSLLKGDFVERYTRFSDWMKSYWWYSELILVRKYKLFEWVSRYLLYLFAGLGCAIGFPWILSSANYLVGG